LATLPDMNNNSGSLMLFEDTNNNNFDSSFQVEDLVVDSNSNNNNGTSNKAKGKRAALHESIPVRRSHALPANEPRRRSSVTTAILATMGRLTFSNNKEKSPRRTNTAPPKYDWTRHETSPTSPSRSLRPIMEVDSCHEKSGNSLAVSHR
jgi:hypothetical protein